MDALLPSLPTLLVLRALEDGPAHGYKIARWVDENSEGVLTLKEGTLYPLLHQLEKKGLLQGDWQKAGTERPMKVYEITDIGRKLLGEERDTWGRKASAAEKLLFKGGLANGLA